MALVWILWVTPYGLLWASILKEDEVSWLKEQAKAIKEQLEQIEFRMQDLEAKE